MRRAAAYFLAFAALAAIRGCAPASKRHAIDVTPGLELVRRGDEIVIAGRFFHTGAPVVLWTDPGGYDAYRTDRRFVPPEEAAWAPGQGPPNPNRYGRRALEGDPDSLDDLRTRIDQFVIHYDAAGTSRQCFKILHDVRGLSVHFMIDIDGTIYQTLDVKEKAWHATIANDRSVGVEIAQIGAYPIEGTAGRKDERTPLDEWYARDGWGPYVTIPAWQGDGGIHTPGFVARPARPELIVGEIQGKQLVQFDLTPEQYDSLAHLTATLCAVLPAIRCDYPRDASGAPLTRALTPGEFASYRGLLGHYHIQSNKVDPGPAFDWERLVREAHRLTP